MKAYYKFFIAKIRLIAKRILNPNNVFITQNWPDITNKQIVYLSSVAHGRSHIRMALDTSIIGNWKINNPTCDVVNDVNQDFSLKYSNNKMGINDVINKWSINNTHANLLLWKLIKRNLKFNELKFIFSLMIDSSIKHQSSF